jgi:putative heme degradation protein
VTGSDNDPRVAELRTAVSRLRRELAAHPAEFADRGIAEDELAALAAMTIDGTPEVPRLRRSLLLIAGAIGSVSALSRGMSAVREAVESFGEPRRRPGNGPQ